MSRREETAALHREHILSAAEALFALKGFDATTIDDISKACGYSRRTSKIARAIFTKSGKM